MCWLPSPSACASPALGVGGLRTNQRCDLLLYRKIPLGTTPSAVQRAFPDAAPLQSEGNGLGSLSEMKARADVLGVSTALEFKFEGDSLYAVSFNPSRLPAN
jgi:hypothetical protein